MQISAYPDDPVGFVEDVLNVRPDRWQCELLEAVRDRNKVAVRSSTGQGKDWIACAAVLWFLSSFEKAYCPCTANSRDQLQLILWKQFAGLIDGSRGLGEVFQWTATTVRHKVYPSEWLAFAKTASKKVSASTGESHAEGASGHHADNMLILIDEASGVDEEFWQAYEPTLTGENNKILAIGNPNRLSGSFFSIWYNSQVAGFWRKFTIAGRPHPLADHVSERGNQSGNHDYLLAKYGDRNPVVISKVYGVHPTQAPENTSYGFEEVQAARVAGRIVPTDEDDVQIGVDVARFGGDRSIITIRRGRHFVQRKFSRLDTVQLSAEVANVVAEFPDRSRGDGKPLVVIDETGVGGGVVDICRKAGLRVKAVSFNSRPRKPALYTDIASEMWMGDLKEYFKCRFCNRIYEAHDLKDESHRYDPNCELPDDDELLAQLTSRTYSYSTKSGKPNKKVDQRRLQSKDDMKSKGFGSPDEADSLCLAVVKPVTPGIY